MVLLLLAFAEKVGQIRLTRTAERRRRRAELIRSYTNDFHLSRDVVELFMDIDHERFNYDSTFLGSDRELALIHLLDNFNALGHSWRRHVISLNDLLPTTLAYAALRTWENPSVRRYLSQIQIWDENRYWPGLGFRYFEDLAVEIRFLCHRQPRVKRADDPALSTHFRRPVALAVLLRFPGLYRIWRIGQSTLSQSNATAGIDRQGQQPASDDAGTTDRETVQ
jgi:hypothetical protein